MIQLVPIVISFFLAFCLSFLSIIPQASADGLISHAPADAEAYIITPTDGDSVAQTFTVKFGLSGMGIAPAGVERENTGHHHLLVDLADSPDLTASLPANDRIRHFGGGQTETQLTLPPGEHTLQLLLGNYVHVPHDNPVMSKKITISVK
ncbi:conserved exported hypothetical protein [Hyella patelloides LEGE 07179]|uniref:DUF4399 domain-containing protein n=1 Tax=Hyella patelloides LEGE 07179 TaxID=945734 RepID=A0A563W1H1_9CYAN|nr:DUF4399 domain-containing protein [Hyella patelloides]VEP17506.1 conserved exported hypothetical protein [Hyella patelloides LEGE 07179]